MTLDELAEDLRDATPQSRVGTFEAALVEKRNEDLRDQKVEALCQVLLVPQQELEVHGLDTDVRECGDKQLQQFKTDFIPLAQ